MNNKKSFWLKTKPYTPEEAVQRIRIAQGDFRQAMRNEHARVNGHSYILHWNDYRQYYILEYYWAGRKVLARSTNFAVILDTAIRVYESAGKGS